MGDFHKKQNPRLNPPAITGCRPEWIREDEWLCYSFGHDREEGDEWIVARNSQDMVHQPMWIGSVNRSHFPENLFPDREKLEFHRLFQHDRRFGEFRLGWQDPDNPLLVHELGSFQVDRIHGFRGVREEDPRPGIFFEYTPNSVSLGLESDRMLEIGNPHCPRPGLRTHRISRYLATRVLGKSIDEIMVSFLQEDHRNAELAKKQKSPPVLPAKTAIRDYFLSFAWDNYTAAPDLYSRHLGKLGMYSLAP